jgi:hypothetical protein
MKRFVSIQWVAFFLGALGTGCAGQSNVDNNFGRALAEAQTRQVENPGAGETLVEVEGMGPATAEEVIANYHRNQETQVQEQRLDRLRQGGIVDTSGR